MRYPSQRRFLLLASISVMVLGITLAVNGAEQRDVRIQPGVRERGNKWAVIIGINDYENKGILDLEYAVADATAIYQLLIDEQYGGFKADQVELLTTDKSSTKPSQRNILKALTKIENIASKEDTIFIFFSGHGIEDSGVSYFLPADADIAILRDTGIPMERFIDTLNRTKARIQVMFFDACHSGVRKDKSLSGRLSKRQFSRLFTDDAEGRVILSSCDADEVSYEYPEEGHGVFSYYLIKALKGDADTKPMDGYVTISEASNYITKNVKNWAYRTGRKQNPHLLLSNVSGDIVLTQSHPGDRESRYLVEENVIVKAIGKSLKTVAYSDKSANSSMAFQLDIMKHYYVLRENTDDQWLHIEDPSGRQKEGYLPRENAVLWKTREGLVLEKKANTPIPTIGAFRDINNIKRGAIPYYNPSSSLSEAAKPWPATYAFPLLEQREVDVKGYGERTVYKVLFPSGSVEALNDALVDPASTLPKLDVAFVVDCSRSMQPHIDAIKEALYGILERLKNAKINCLVAVIGYRDLPDPDVIMFRQFETVEESINTLTRLMAKDSYDKDKPEAMYDACLAAVTHLQWRQGSDRYMIIVPNTRSHVPTRGTEITRPGKDADDIIALALGKQVKIHGLQAGGNDDEAYTQIKYFAKQAGGVAYEHGEEGAFYRTISAMIAKLEGREYSPEASNGLMPAAEELFKMIILFASRGEETAEQGVFVQDGWMIAPSGFKQCVLFTEAELIKMIDFLKAVAYYDIKNMQHLENVMAQELKQLTGEDIDPNKRKMLDDFLSESLGIHYKSNLLHFDPFADDDKWMANEEFFKKITARCDEKSKELAQYKLLNARRLRESGMVWIPIDSLP